MKERKEIELRNQTFPLINSLSDTAIHQQNSITENPKLMSFNRTTQSIIKRIDVEDWIVQHQHFTEESNLCTKSTQTYISSCRNGKGFYSVNDPHHSMNIVTPHVCCELGKESKMDNDELTIIKSRLFNVQKHYKKLKLRFHKLHEDYQKMNEVAEKMTIALENSIRGQPVDLDMVLQSCTNIIPNRFININIQTDLENINADLNYAENKNNSIIKNAPINPKFLDYKKIKLHLKCGNIKTKLLLLQALRQKLTLNQSDHRNETIYEYVNKDLLGIQENTENHVLSYILPSANLKTTENLIQQTTSRFLNALASLRCGRNYLTSGPIILNIIIKYLDSYKNGLGDLVTLDMILATLQKMSLRKEQRKYMIEANLVEWLIHQLSNENFRIRTYRLEYSCALLMNLSLQSSARNRASLIAPLFASTIISLLSTNCISILPYVNGALQNFLLNNEINEEAKKLHLTEILEYHLMKSDEVLREYFSHTLKIHKRECDDYISDDEFPDEDDEIFDVLENELEESDPIKVKVGELQGENLLAVYYSDPTLILETHGSSTKKVDDISTIKIKDLSLRVIEETSNISKIPVTTETKFDDYKVAESTVKRKSEEKELEIVEELPQEEKMKLLEHDEDAFLSKPKLMRTPPNSARNDRERFLEE